jgi:hypothetical protein
MGAFEWKFHETPQILLIEMSDVAHHGRKV